MPDFVHLHVHSEFSLLDGANRIKDLPVRAKKVGDFDTELVEEFWLGFVRKANIALHIKKLAGTNTHHIIEGAFKSVGHSLRKAVAIDNAFADEIPSTKGVL